MISIQNHFNFRKNLLIINYFYFSKKIINFSNSKNYLKLLNFLLNIKLAFIIIICFRSKILKLTKILKAFIIRTREL